MHGHSRSWKQRARATVLLNLAANGAVGTLQPLAGPGAGRGLGVTRGCARETCSPQQAKSQPRRKDAARRAGVLQDRFSLGSTSQFLPN